MEVPLLQELTGETPPGALVLGSITQDFVDGPGVPLTGHLGGSATYFALAARHFGPVRVVGAVGRDRAPEVRELLEFADLSGLTVTGEGTSTWRARRDAAGGEATTLERFTGAASGYRPRLPERADLPAAVFLGSLDPGAQLRLVRLLRDVGDTPRMGVPVTGADTMDVFISATREQVLDVFGRVDIAFLNSRELNLLTGLAEAEAGARWMLAELHLLALVEKRGPEGAVLWTAGCRDALPAPVVPVVDPTGAGDALAGAFLGRLAQARDLTPAGLLDALGWGLAAAGFAIAGAGTTALRAASADDLASAVVAVGRP